MRRCISKCKTSCFVGCNSLGRTTLADGHSVPDAALLHSSRSDYAEWCFTQFAHGYNPGTVQSQPCKLILTVLRSPVATTRTIFVRRSHLAIAGPNSVLPCLCLVLSRPILSFSLFNRFVQIEFSVATAPSPRSFPLRYEKGSLPSGWRRSSCSRVRHFQHFHC